MKAHQIGYNSQKTLSYLGAYLSLLLIFVACESPSLPSQNYFLDKEILSDTLGNSVLINYNYNSDNQLISISDGIRETRLDFGENEKVSRATYSENGVDVSYYQYTYTVSDTLIAAQQITIKNGNPVKTGEYQFSYNNGNLIRFNFFNENDILVEYTVRTFDGSGNIESEIYFVKSDTDSSGFKNTGQTIYSYSGLNPYALLPTIFEDMFPNIQNNGLNAVSQIRYQAFNGSSDVFLNVAINFTNNTLPTGFVESIIDNNTGVKRAFEYIDK